MKRSISNLLLVAVTLAFFAACASNAKEGGEGDATPPTTENKAPTVDATNPHDADAAAAEADMGPKTTIEFADIEHDFGTIDEGDKVTHIFKFKNTGGEPLVITSAKGSCGCTVPEWPKEPIAPGGDGEIKVEFNSKGKKNKQTKTVTINANTDPNPTRLTIKADVTPDPNASTPAVKSVPAPGK